MSTPVCKECVDAILQEIDGYVYYLIEILHGVLNSSTKFRYAENARQEKKSFASYLQTNFTSTLRQEEMDQLEEKIQFVSTFI